MNGPSRFLLVALLGVGVSAPAQQTPSTPQPPKASPAVTKKAVGNINADLQAARTANKEKRYADAEALMLQRTAAQPELLLPWIELGTAQLGLKKYAEAERSFKTALGIYPVEQKSDLTDGHHLVELNSAPPPPVVAPFGSTVTTGGERTPELISVAFSNLGEIYARTNRVAEAQSAFDAAANAEPAQAPLFRRNEAIFFYQAGDADAELDAALKAIELNPADSLLYYLKGHALVEKATIDPKTQNMVFPPGCTEAFQRYLEIDPNGQFASDAKTLLTAAGIPIRPAVRR